MKRKSHKKWLQFVKDFREALELDLEWYYRRCNGLFERCLARTTEKEPTLKEFIKLLRKEPWFSGRVYEICEGESAHKHLENGWIKITVDGATFEVLGDPGTAAQLHKWVGQRFPKLLYG